jgi:hypothetical protein
MHASLLPHPATAHGPVRSIEVDVSRVEPAELTLRFRVAGTIDDLQLSEFAPPIRTDELWRHTCFEAFVQLGGGYCEFNLSPSSQWAAYSFTGYRSDMAPLDIPAPAIRTEIGENELVLRALIDLSVLQASAAESNWQLGLAAVIEQTDGQLSYWALAHPAPKPDFHHQHCFVLQLPPARRR